MREWERRETVHRRRDAADLRFFGDRDVIDRRRDRVIYGTPRRPFVVNPAPQRFWWRANAYDTYELDNGWRETTIVRDGNVRVVTIVDASGVPIRRYREYPDGRTVTLFNNLPTWWEGDRDLYVDLPPVRVGMPRDEYIVEPSRASVDRVYRTVVADPVQEVDRSYTLNQILYNENVRDLMPRVDIDTVTFATGSAEVPVDQVAALETIGVAIEEAVADDPQEVFLIEGHTDAVGSDIANLELSDRRAESVATLLTEYFEIPPENLVSQGFGEQYLKVQTSGASQENRRVTVRRLTPLLSTEDQIAGFDESQIVE